MANGLTSEELDQILRAGRIADQFDQEIASTEQARLENEQTISNLLGSRPTGIGTQLVDAPVVSPPAQPVSPGPMPPDIMIADQTIPGRLVDPEVAQLYGGPSEAFLDPLNRFTAPPGLERPPEDRFTGVRELAEKTRQAAFFVSPEVQAARANLASAEKDLKDLEADPFSFITDGKSKAMAIIGLILGEAARGFSGGKVGNVASDLLFKFADMEMKKSAQKRGKLQSLLSSASQRLGSEITASNMIRDALVRGYQTQLDLGLKELQMEDEAAAVAAQIAKDLQISRENRQADVDAKAEEQRKRLLPKYGDTTEARTAAGVQEETSRALSAAIDGIDKMAGKGADIRKEVGFFGVSLKKLNNILDTVIKETVDKGGAVGASILAQLSSKAEGAIILRNAVDAIAFGLASQGQSSSAISDNDVLIFKRLLADARLSNDSIKEFLEHLKMKAEAERFYQRAIQAGGNTVQDAEEFSQAQMKKEYGIDYDPSVGLLTDLIKRQRAEAAAQDKAFEGLVQ